MWLESAAEQGPVVSFHLGLIYSGFISSVPESCLGLNLLMGNLIEAQDRDY